MILQVSRFLSNLKNISNPVKLSLLLLFPVLILIVGFSLNASKPAHYLIITDPEYPYLISSLNFAQLKIVTGNYFHPGIPLQVINGIIIRGTYIFGGKNNDIVTDVMLRPEYYISAINGAIFFLTAFIFLICGYIIFKTTNSLIAAFFLQGIPFLSIMPFVSLMNICPEKLVLPFMLILVVLLIRYVQLGINKKKEIILLGIVVGICVMQKLTMVPLIFMPFFILNGTKNNLRYIVSLFVSIAILSLPVIHALHSMFDFFISMTTHSGIYGSGEQKVIEVSSIIPNFKILFHNYPLTMCFFVILLILIPLTFINKTKSVRIIRIRSIMLGLITAETLMLLMVVKHFKIQYIAPDLALTFFNIYLIVEYIKESGFIIWKYFSHLVYMGIILFLLIINITAFASMYHYYDKYVENENSLMQIESQYKFMPKIIMQAYYGNPFVESSISAGINYSDNRRQYYQKLKELYPKSYNYSAKWGTYDMGNKVSRLVDVLKKHKNFIVSYYAYDTITLKNFFKEINDGGLKNSYKLKRLYYYADLQIIISELYYINDSLNDSNKIFSLECNMEQTKENFKNPIYLNSKNCISQDIALSGKSSIKLGEANELGAKVLIGNIRKNDVIRASVWHYRNGNQKYQIVMSGENPSDFYVAGNEVIEANSGWDLIEITAKIPDKANLDKIIIYILQQDKSSPSYFDDFKVTQYRFD